MKPLSSRDRLEQALLGIADPNGEGAKACLTVYAEAARAAAERVRTIESTKTLTGGFLRA